MVSANVVTAGHDTIHDQGHAHGVEHAGVLGDPVQPPDVDWRFRLQVSTMTRTEHQGGWEPGKL